jgi:hypothetical protein
MAGDAVVQLFALWYISPSHQVSKDTIADTVYSAASSFFYISQTLERHSLTG